jgi:hypothetical protein
MSASDSRAVTVADVANAKDGDVGGSDIWDPQFHAVCPTWFVYNGMYSTGSDEVASSGVAEGGKARENSRAST